MRACLLYISASSWGHSQTPQAKNFYFRSQNSIVISSLKHLRFGGNCKMLKNEPMRFIQVDCISAHSCGEGQRHPHFVSAFSLPHASSHHFCSPLLSGRFILLESFWHNQPTSFLFSFLFSSFESLPILKLVWLVWFVSSQRPSEGPHSLIFLAEAQ